MALGIVGDEISEGAADINGNGIAIATLPFVSGAIHHQLRRLDHRAGDWPKTAIRP